MSELKLDFEQKNPQKRLSISRLQFISQILRLTILKVKAYRTTNGIHVRLETKEKMHPITVVMVQTLMGSDYAREAYNAIRVYNLEKGNYSREAKELWNVLFYKKKIAGQVASQEVYDPKLTRKIERKLKEEE
jgi:hypothetical protein